MRRFERLVRVRGGAVQFFNRIHRIIMIYRITGKEAWRADSASNSSQKNPVNPVNLDNPVKIVRAWNIYRSRSVYDPVHLVSI